MKIFYEDDFLKISYSNEFKSDRCLVVFTGVGHAMGAINIQREEFYNQHKLGKVIWITDKKRSWGNNLNIKKISNAVKKISENRKIYIIGNSMGGFLAILFSKFLEAKKVISFSPQFSVCPDIVPDEIRWMNYRQFIDEYRYKDLSDSFDKNTKYALLIGDGQHEDIHYNNFIKFSSLSNIELIRFRDTGHKVASNLKNLNLLNQSIDIFFTDQSLRNFLNRNSINFE
tara:strand:+ start:257 stop:940 length:684 start_codon:yes stop_codon:yes gene_type:complete